MEWGKYCKLGYYYRPATLVWHKISINGLENLNFRE